MIAIHSGGNSITWWIDVQSDSAASNRRGGTNTAQHSPGCRLAGSSCAAAPWSVGWGGRKRETSIPTFYSNFPSSPSAWNDGGDRWKATENTADNLMLLFTASSIRLLQYAFVMIIGRWAKLMVPSNFDDQRPESLLSRQYHCDAIEITQVHLNETLGFKISFLVVKNLVLEFDTI